MVHSSDRLFAQPRHSGLGCVYDTTFPETFSPREPCRGCAAQHSLIHPCSLDQPVQPQHWGFAAQGGSVLVPLQWLLPPAGEAPLCTQGWLCFFLVFIYFHDTVLWSCSQKGLNLCLSASFLQALWALGCGGDRDVCWGHWKAELEKASRQCLFCPWAVPLGMNSPIFLSLEEKASMG